jgi:hypothetical protein
MELARQPLYEHDLLQLLNWELSAYAECEGCRFTAITANDGRGWDARVEGGAAAAQTVARQVVVETRRAFDLAP